ncbi:PREDICTED: recQ-mediated genome instability protein 1-like isoform X2 [Trachymyrmex cornetzi]|uniref:recQ-mediated genome instability protein 1-like isoform X2 n=1 Tax=Trachymyrmex cornetzi TaxID=471704 RepID=UPI00084F1D30|nr:PREDICTED: recQ-mediated genome instability protein 1-like isoform X2 [Trachymyrmex cornetzi]
MNENLLRRIKNQLNAKFYVMNDAWLRDCVEFFIKDKVSHEMTDKHIFEFVEGQWQLSDLREINNENGCLPRNLAQQTHIVLTGTYILQVDKMYDIASSKYKQLCEIRKIDNQNLEVKEEEQPIEWQPKGRRMMQFCLTDGVQDVTAIEYTPLKQITDILLPGYKVMIIGPIHCRRGVILLEDGKYKEVGGEVETLLKSNALENVLARALGEPENPDPYNDNGLSRIMNQNAQNTASNSNNDNFFDDDFEEAVDLEAVTAIEQRSQEINAVQENFRNTCDRKQVDRKETNEIMETLEDIDFEPLEDWSNNFPTRSSWISPSQMKTKKIDKDDRTTVEQTTSVLNFHSKLSLSTKSIQNQNFSEFPDDDFDLDDCDIIIKTKESQSQQSENPLINKTKTCHSLELPTKLTNRNALIEVKKSTSIKAAQNEKSVPQLAPKICDVLRDVLREPITEKIYKTVRGQVKNHSTLTKQGKCWSVTALITDYTSSVEVCFDSEVLEGFLGFTVQEFLQKKKLAKLDPQVKNELRLSLRKAQHDIQNLDALLKLELVQGQMPKIVGITQLTTQQREDLMKRSA